MNMYNWKKSFKKLNLSKGSLVKLMKNYIMQSKAVAKDNYALAISYRAKAVVIEEMIIEQDLKLQGA